MAILKRLKDAIYNLTSIVKGALSLVKAILSLFEWLDLDSEKAMALLTLLLKWWDDIE